MEHVISLAAIVAGAIGAVACGPSYDSRISSSATAQNASSPQWRAVLTDTSLSVHSDTSPGDRSSVSAARSSRPDVPAFRIKDLGPEYLPSAPEWRPGACHDEGLSQTSYVCGTWQSSYGARTLGATTIWVGYSSSRGRAYQPVENVTGCCGITSEREGLRDLPIPAGETSAEAVSLSPQATYIVGFSDVYGASLAAVAGPVHHAIEWIRGAPRVLSALGGDDPRLDATASGVNSRGEVVGASATSLPGGSDTAMRATLWVDQVPYQLDRLVSPPQKLVLTDATLIDCEGDVAAQGSPLTEDATQHHAYLLTRIGRRRDCPGQ